MNHANDPRPLRREEWEEIAALEFVRDSWGLDPLFGSLGEQLSLFAYGARYDFASGGPGYVGDLYTIQGDAFGDAPLQFFRNEKGAVELVELSCPYGRCAA